MVRKGRSKRSIESKGMSKSKSMGNGMRQMMQQQQQRSKGRGRGRSQGIGGYWGAVLETAIVPLTLLGLQQTFRRKKHSNGKTRKH
jgi:hypothetical protein